MRAVKPLAILAAMALVGVSSFAIGGRLGFYEGYLVAGYLREVTSASTVLHSLAAHDRGECEAGRGMLEIMVDGALISDWAHHDIMNTPPFYAPSEFYELDLPKVLHLLAQYRESHPHEIPEPGASAIRATLARLAGEREPH